ncbi:oligosaccharide biosynthesis protein Alg14-like protein [Cladochytrium replicatum]|nr:oligosaccharide biosynthesis protein Alg14-like protein [Cladochytrium replicatum]
MSVVWVTLWVLTLVARAAYFVLPRFVRKRSRNAKRFDANQSRKSTQLWIVLGSGGHTTEMLRMLHTLPIRRFQNRRYLIAQTDSISATKAIEFERAVTEKELPKQSKKSRSPPAGNNSGSFEILRVPRSREVGQSWVSTVITTVLAFFRIMAMMTALPDMIICNGPGTCIPVIYAAFLLRVFGIKHIKVIFVETYARVRKLSLSGILAYPFVDRFLVQWEYLASPTTYPWMPQIEYLGRLV